MAKMPKEVIDVFNDPKSTKVLATAGTILEINAVPKGSLRALDEELMAFADIFGDKTNKNLEVNKKVAALALRMDPIRRFRGCRDLRQRPGDDGKQRSRPTLVSADGDEAGIRRRQL